MDTLQAGEDFVLQAYVKDIRSSPQGVFQAYFDFSYNSSLASANGPLVHGSAFNTLTSGTSTNGLIDEAGGVDTDQVPPVPREQELLLLSAPLHANNPGVLDIVGDLADTPGMITTFFDTVSGTLLQNIDFVDGSVEITAAGIQVNPTSGLTTTEASGTATFDVVLTKAPSANVTIGLSSSDTSEGTVSPSSLTFTSANWSTPKTVTVTGQDDLVDDGSIAYSVVTAAAVSSDPNYNGLDPDDVSLTNSDNDTAGINVSPNSGLGTTEAGGEATFQIELTSQPTADVTIGLTSNDTSEGVVSVPNVVFTPSNWSTPKTITVTGQDDDIDDDSVAYAIITAATSGDSKYDGMEVADVSLVNSDNDTAGIDVSPNSGRITTEAGGTDTFQIVLTSEPTADVTVGLTSSDTSEGTVSVANVVFTAANWDSPRTVTVTGQNDDVDDDDVHYTIVTAAAASGDSKYNGMDAVDISVVNLDNDTAGINVSPTSGLETTEAGGKATFQIELTSQPTADVTLNLTSSDTSEGSVSSPSVVFTSSNWDTAKTITITGENDNVDDDDVHYTIVTSATASDDAKYGGMSVPDVSVVNRDNDTAGIDISPTSGLETTEAGGSDTFQIVLTSQPTADVTVGLTSSNTSEGLVSSPSVTFTAVNWKTPQTVTVSGVDDAVDDGDISYTIFTAPAASNDSKYGGIDAANIAVLNRDDDTAGIDISLTEGLETTEAGGVDTFEIVLTSQPTADVTIGLTSSDTSEGTVLPVNLVFTSSDWNTPRTVTVTGQDDAIDDDDVDYMVVTTAAVSNDSKYGGMDVGDVSVVNRDDDTVGIDISPTSGLETTEAGGTDTFDVVLTSEPTAQVTIGLTSSDANEGTASVESLVFNASNWDTPQTVTVTGQDDFVDDGDQAFTIFTAKAVSNDAKYSDLDAADVAAVNVDNDTAGVLATPLSGLETTEAGHSDTFTIELTSQPTANVTIDLTSNNVNEGTVAPASLTFTPTDWNVPQTVTVTGQDDAVQDGDVAYSVVLEPATSSDSVYNGLDPTDVTVVNLDDDIPGFFVIPTTGLETTEGGGQATFEVMLRMQPASDVTIDLASSNTSEGTVSDTSLVFTSENWAMPQEITVTGQDDAVDDDDIAYTIVLDAAVSDDPDYNGLDPDDVTLTNVDDDTAGITVLPDSGLETTEAGGTDTFQIVLSSEPTADVTIGLASSALSEGTVLPASVEFSSSNWNIPQTITVTGQDDAVDDGDVSYTIVTAAAASGDSKYFGMNADDVLVINRNDDTAGIEVSPTSGLETTEVGGADSFQIVLTSEPTADVTIALASDDTSEGTVSSTSVIFTPVNWNMPQTLTVTGQNDAVDDGDVDYTIVTTAAMSNDPKYEGMSVDDVSVVNRDDDTAGVNVSPTSGLETTEAGGTDTFQIVLASEPTASVTIGLTSSDSGEGTASVVSVVFTTSNWNTPQTVMITGQDDAVDDDDVTYTVVTAAASSNDPKYGGMAVDDVSVVNRDNDTAGIDVSPTSGIETTEAGGTGTFQIVLSSQPTADVAIGLTSSDTSEGTVSATSVVFTSSNWNTPQTLTITGVDDAVDDDDVNYAIVTTVATSNDEKYAEMSVDDVSVVNRDDDTAGILVSPTSGLGTTEAGGTDTFEIVLASEPTSNVTVGLMSNDVSEGTVSAAELVFTPGNWNIPRTVTITGQDDFVDDGDVAYAIVTNAVSSDAKYAEMAVEDTSVVNENDDTAEVLVSPTSGLETTEAGGVEVLQIRLGSQPLADVAVSLASSDTGEGTVSAATLTFNGTNWDTLQTVTVIGQDDEAVDGNVNYTIAVSSTSSDSKYDAVNVNDVTVTNRDDDSAVLTLSSVTGTADEGSSGTVEYVFEVSLSGSVEGGFHIAYTTDDDTATTADGDYVDNDGVLVFAGASGETKTISVRVNGDSQVELDERFLVSLGDLSQISPSAADRISVEGSPATGEIDNDDTAILTIADVSRVEGTGGTASDFTFSVVLSNAVQGGLSVSYATSDGSATSGSGDYGAESGTLKFNGSAGETKTVTVQVAHDAIVERDEVFRLALLDLDDLLTPQLADDIQISGSPATGMIENDDSATVSFADSSSLVIEAMGSHAVDVVLDITSGGTLSESVTVNVSDLLTGSAQTAQDYTLGTSSVTFGAGQR